MQVEEEVLECADCGSILSEGEPSLENVDGECICADCAAEYTSCADCSEIVPKDSDYLDENGNPICESCSEHYFSCNDCGRVIHDDNGTWIVGIEALVCNTCLDDHYYRCEDCGRYVTEEGSFCLGSGGRICQNCFERGDYYRCCDCGELYHNSALNFDDDEDYCDDCYRVRRESGAMVIHPYSYKPSWIYHRTDFEKRHSEADAFFLGVELEVENTSGGAYSNPDTAKTVLDLAAVICKHDSSIQDGFEIVFHPQTYAYAATDGKPAIENCLGELRRRRFSGHNYGGMHVHICLNAFSRLHLFKFHRLFRNARPLFTAISQRKPDKLEQWAGFSNLPASPYNNIDRYCALNYTRQTVEVRIFNSTLRTDRFYKNLETVKAAIDYTKLCGLQELDTQSFLRFIMQNRGVYRNLSAFLVEKCIHTLSDVVVDVRVVRQVQKRLTRQAV